MKRLLAQLRDAHYASGYLQVCADDALAAADHAANDSTDGAFHIEAA